MIVIRKLPICLVFKHRLTYFCPNNKTQLYRLNNSLFCKYFINNNNYNIYFLRSYYSSLLCTKMRLDLDAHCFDLNQFYPCRTIG